MTSKKLDILKVRDKNDSYYTPIPRLFDLPMRVIVNGRSQLSGKSNFILNLLLREQFKYRNLFAGSDIYIISNNKLDNKMKILMEELDIDPANHMPFDEEDLNFIYDSLEDEFQEAVAMDMKPSNKLIILEDCGYSSALKNKQAGIISKLLCNGRHANISCIMTSQKYSQLSTTVRNNATGCVFFGCAMKEKEQICDDHNIFDNKKRFMTMMTDATRERNSFLLINYSNDISERYLDSNFQPIKAV
tara:strand:- start:31 stop:768 length:738 start_codon:yes stop_codon:yes gene_type:complete